MYQIPMNEKFTLSIKEASQYFGLGEKKLRQIVNSNPQAKFVLWNGNRMQIKRSEFENFLNEINSL